MGQYYPAIFYPSLILNFLAKNSTSKLVSSQSIKNQFPSQESSDSSLSILVRIFFLLLGFLIPFSLSILSPLWLVAIVWIAITLGIYTAIFIVEPKTSNSKKSLSQSLPTILGRQTHPTQNKQREAQLYQLLSNKVLQPRGKSDAQAGVSEKNFYRILKQIFPQAIQGMAFDNPNFSYPYSADFVLVHTSGLSIDIEIDEPYVGNTKAPHHCIDQKKDEIRNNFFTGHNWIVVRFSEKQVVKYPYSCCKVIADVLARITGDYSFSKQLQNIPPLHPDAMWNLKKAKKWAKLDYRNTYLN